MSYRYVFSCSRRKNWETAIRARFILRGYRPGAADAGDLLFREALNQAAHGYALAAWFENEPNLATKISERSGAVSPSAVLHHVIPGRGTRNRARASATPGWPVKFSTLNTEGCRRLDRDSREISQPVPGGDVWFHCYIREKKISYHSWMGMSAHGRSWFA